MRCSRNQWPFPFEFGHTTISGAIATVEKSRDSGSTVIARVTCKIKPRCSTSISISPIPFSSSAIRNHQKVKTYEQLAVSSHDLSFPHLSFLFFNAVTNWFRFFLLCLATTTENEIQKRGWSTEWPSAGALDFSFTVLLRPLTHRPPSCHGAVGPHTFSPPSQPPPWPWAPPP